MTHTNNAMDKMVIACTQSVKLDTDGLAQETAALLCEVLQPGHESLRLTFAWPHPQVPICIKQNQSH